jgi:predicted transcriptional regulator
MLRKSLVTILFAGALFGSTAAVASAQTAPIPLGNTVQCAGAAEHKQAQALRLQAAQADIAFLNARKAAAQAANRPKAVTRIDKRIAEVTQRIAKIQANQAKFLTRCP